MISVVYNQVRFSKHKRKNHVQSYNRSSENTIYTQSIKITKAENLLETRSPSRHAYMSLRARIKSINRSQTVYNLVFGPMTGKTFVIVIQVHSNVIFLSQLLESMKKASGIFNALLIFSHDYWDEEINRLIKTVQFAKYIQIFYPYSLQLYPNVFPGEDSKLCTNSLVCTNSTLRNPKASQAKLHWWWLVNQVFDNMPITSNCDNILFLEEGNYVTEDFLFLLKSLEVAKLLHCPYCELISLAAHKRLGTYQYHKLQDTALVEIWTDAMPKTGLTFDRAIWKVVKSRSKDFCYYNDSRWDRSLVHNLKYKKSGSSGNDLYVIAVNGPRVFNLDECKIDGCNPKVELQQFIKEVSKDLFPRNLLIGRRKAKGMNFMESAGDWFDYRDRKLCMRFTKKSMWL